ncbi:hypothetical protein LCGC14_2532740 [marine sediment metagenome]|uniref:Uncharacterized protein n=1 Tax=marine sediment metagenome TaxID=412755 RepID=A0A0F9BG02_9ZZZZ
MREPPLLRVEWIDCVMLENKWQEEEDILASKTLIVSVGFRIKEEDGFLYLGATWQGDPRHIAFAQPIAIPIRAIVKKRRIGH